MSSRAASSLRAITYRLASTPPKQLPSLIPHIASTLLDCKTLLSAPQSTSKDSTDSVVVHKFKTQLTSFLNDKRYELRWSAIILIKAMVDLGGWEILQSNGASWVRGLLSILGKPLEPPSTKNVAVVTLTRIFVLMQEFPTLIREITTPNLPAFVTSCLNFLAPKTGLKTAMQVQIATLLMPTVLECFIHLLPKHPTIFRTFLPQLRSLLLPLITSTPSNTSKDGGSSASNNIDSNTAELARALFTLLPICAPNQKSVEDWTSSLTSLLSSTHTTCDNVFRSVVEDWQSFAGVPHPAANGSRSQSTDLGEVPAASKLGLPAWSGIHAGCERLTGQLSLLQHFISSQTLAPITFPIGRVIDLLSRVLSLTVPLSSAADGANGEGMRLNTSISREEREGLFSELPSVHVVAIEVISALCDRFEGALLPLRQIFVEQIIWVFKHEKYNVSVRVASYTALNRIIAASGTEYTKEGVSGIRPIILACCEDVLPTSTASTSQPQPTSQNSKTAKSTTTMNADSFLQTTKATVQTTTPPTTLTHVALVLLITTLSTLPARHISQSLRSVLDRTAVLSCASRAMLASVLNPPPNSKLAKAHSSILPLLARASKGSLEVEGLLRPRMPVLQMRYEDEDEDEEDEMMMREDINWSGMEGLGGDGDRGTQGLSVEENGLDGVDALITATSTNDFFNSNRFIRPTAPSTSVFGASAIAAVPDITPESAHAAQSSLRKRAIPSLDAATQDPKRSRFSAPTTAAPLDANILVENPSDRNIAVLPLPVVAEEARAFGGLAVATTPIAVPGTTATKTDAEDSDESDFEIPEINVELDTEDEEDEVGGVLELDQS